MWKLKKIYQTFSTIFLLLTNDNIVYKIMLGVYQMYGANLCRHFLVDIKR